MNKSIKSSVKENRIHGNNIFPFTIYHVKFDNLFLKVNPHWHNEIEIIYIKKGILHFQIDLDSFIANEGDIIFINSEQLHTLKPINPGEDCECITIVFDIKQLCSIDNDVSSITYLSKIIDYEYHITNHIIYKNKGYTEIQEIIIKMIDIFSSASLAYELAIKGLLFTLLSILFREQLIVRNNNHINIDNLNKIKLVIRYIHNHYDNEITIKTLADLCSYNEQYFIRFFKKNTGVNAITFINHYRLDEAAKLLLSTDSSILEISYEVGFSNISYFIRSFKNKFNTTPSEYRKKHRN